MDKQQSKRVGTPQDDVDPVSSVGNLAARMMSQNQSACGVDAQISQRGRGPLGKWRFPRFRSVKETQVNVDCIRWEIPPPPGFGLGQDNGKPEKGAKGRGELPDENKDTEEAEEHLRIPEPWC